MDMAREDVVIRTADGDCRASVFHPDGGGPWPGVIFFMDGIGIRPALFEMCSRIANAGYVVLLPDLYYRAGDYEPIDPKALFANPANRAKLAPLMGSTDNLRAGRDDTRAFLDTLARRSDVAGSKVGVTGYCMGGGIALTAAAMHPDRIAAAASFHGGRLATEDEKSPHRFVNGIRARVLVAGADQDASFPVEQKRALEGALREAGVDARVEIWPGALHGWTMSDFPIYHPEAAERHYRELLALYDACLKPE
jgi:carboxymethylenebutenolidase